MARLLGNAPPPVSPPAAQPGTQPQPQQRPRTRVDVQLDCESFPAPHSYLHYALREHCMTQCRCVEVPEAEGRNQNSEDDEGEGDDAQSANRDGESDAQRLARLAYDPRFIGLWKREEGDREMEERESGEEKKKANAGQGGGTEANTSGLALRPTSVASTVPNPGLEKRRGRMTTVSTLLPSLTLPSVLA